MAAYYDGSVQLPTHCLRNPYLVSFLRKPVSRIWSLLSIPILNFVIRSIPGICLLLANCLIKCRIVSWTAIVKGYVTATNSEETFASMFYACTNLSRLVCGEQLHGNVFSLGLRDLSSLNSQLSSYLRGGNPNSTLALFLMMHRTSTDLSSHTFTPVLGACALLSYPETGRQVHALMIKQGAETGTISKTALIDMYSKYGDLVDSLTVFEGIEEKDVVSWNALLSGFLRNGKGKQALGVFAAMYSERVEISEYTLCSVVKTCASLKVLQQGKQVHAMVVVTGRDLVVLGTAMISFYSSVGLMSEAMNVYNSLNVHTDEMMLNSLISGCIRNLNYKDAFLLMSRQRPNVGVLTSSLAGCSDNSDMWIGRQIHCVALRNGFVSDSKLCNGLVDMYGKCGQTVQAHTVFRAIPYKSVVSWTSMIDAYAVNGDGVKALAIFKEMCEEGSRVLPNSVTFLVVLSACAHAGLVEEGKECFDMMKEKYRLVPRTEHYVCFIDILSKAGDTEEIWRLVERMKDKINENLPCAIWVAVLSACSLNMDVTRGEYVARRLVEEMGPENPSIYVLVSNFYAAIGKWDMVEEMRGRLKKKGLVKGAGHSLYI